jgi:hypothetical protein
MAGNGGITGDDMKGGDSRDQGQELTMNMLLKLHRTSDEKVREIHRVGKSWART